MSLVHQDITPQLRALRLGHEKQYHFKFNNSMVRHKGNLFYGVYRCLINRMSRKKGHVHQHQKGAIWNTNWKTIIFDGLGVYVAKLGNDGKFKVLYDKVLDDDIVDARIFFIGKGASRKYYILYNTKVHTEKKACFGQLCTALGLMQIVFQQNKPLPGANKGTEAVLHPNTKTIRARESLFTIKLLRPETFPCLDVYTGPVEKNWAFFSWPSATHNPKFVAVYGVAPYKVLVAGLDPAKCKMLQPSKPTVMDNLQKQFPGLIHFSSGSPLVPYGKDEYIGVGHVKYHYKKVVIFPYGHVIKGIKTHGKYVYLSFFYTVSSKAPYGLKRISKCFHIESIGSTKYALNFIIGIDRYKSAKQDVFVVSFGDGDITCNTALFPVNDVERSLSSDLSYMEFTFQNQTSSSEELRLRYSTREVIKAHTRKTTAKKTAKKTTKTKKL
jgi:hypothetical protein